MSPTKGQFPWRIFLKFISVQAFLIVFAVGGAGIVSRFFFKKHFLMQVEHELYTVLRAISHDVPAKPNDEWCINRVRDTRIRLTMIDAETGVAFCDSRYNAALEPILLDRPEIKAVLKTGLFAATERYSPTAQHEMFYGAFLLKGSERGTDRDPSRKPIILRAGIPLVELQETMRLFDRSLLLVSVAVFLVLFAMGLVFGRRFTSPVGKILTAAHDLLGEKDSVLQEQRDEFGDIEMSLQNIGANLKLERKEQATLMGAISDAIVAVDQNFSPLFFNSQFALIFGGNSFSGELPAELKEYFQRAFDSRAAFRTKAIALPGGASKDKSLQSFYTISVSPLKDPEGKVYGAVGIFHDVTELKKAEQIRIDFVANASHELKTPLTAIQGYTETLLQDLDAGRPPERGFLEVISRNSVRLLSLINDLLSLSRTEAAEENVQKVEVDTAELTSRVMDGLKGSLQKKNQIFSLHCDAPFVWADAAKLEQVLINLIYNACKYSPQGSRIDVFWKQAHDFICLIVADNGPGIALEHHERLFERFYRVDKGRARDEGGTGLGLAIVKTILQAHGGDITLESEVGRGSRFTCSFPVV